MRRRRRSDSYNDDDDNTAKRNRFDNNSIESLTYRIGSKDQTNIGRDISELASLILLDIPKNGEKLLKILADCVKNIPERVLIYATMIGLINLKNKAFVGQLMELLQRELKDAIRSALFDDAKFIMLFLSVSVNCNTVLPSSILGLYENFAEVTLDVGRSSQARTDWYAYVILYGLPYSGFLLASHDLAALNDILGTIEVYMTKRQRAHVPLLRVWETDDPHPQEDYLDCLWAQIQGLRSASWQEKVIWRLYDSFPTIKEIGQPHKLTALTPPDYDAEVAYPIPSVIFRMFDYTDVIIEEEATAESDVKLSHSQPQSETPVLPGAHTIERFIIDEQLAIIMNNMNFNRVICAKAMLNLRTRARVALDYMIIEAVFAGIFHLPNPPVQHGHLLFYGSLLIQLCQEASNTIPLVLAQATEVLYERLETMKPVCIRRFIEWFSYHLSNYQLQWSWKEWSGAISQDSMAPQRRLITETLSRLIRFSYYENVKRMLPKPFIVLLPPQPVVINKYEKKSDVQSRTFYRLLDSIRSRCDPDTVLRIAQGSLASQNPNRSISEPFDDPDNHESVDRSDEERRERSPSEEVMPLSDPEFDEPDDSDLGDRQQSRTKLVARRRLLRASAHKFQRNNSHDSEEERFIPPDNLSGDTALDLSPGVTSLPIELFFSALLIAGHKTISHTFAFIKKYSSVIRSLTSTVEAQVEALHVTQAVWANNPQMIVIITEHMCRTGLIDPEAMVRWAYSPIMTSLVETPGDLDPVGARPKILDFYVWECLSRTLARVGRRVTRITNRLESAKESLELARRLPLYSSPYRDVDEEEDFQDDFDRNHSVDDKSFKKPVKLSSGRIVGNKDKRDLMAGCELVSSSDDETSFGTKDSIGSRVARLEEARCEAVRSQCAVITLLLHRHARLTAELASGDSLAQLLVTNSPSALLHGSDHTTKLTDQALEYIAFWLKGRLVQVILEHCDQLVPYLDNLDEFICGAHPEVQDVFQQLRALYA